MLNNSGAYGPNEAPSNMLASINRPQSNPSSIDDNFNDFGKFVQQAASSASGYYEAHNLHNFGQPSVNMPPIMHPFQAYQSMGHGSSYLSQNAQFSYENAEFFQTQADNYKNMMMFNQNLHSNPPELQSLTRKDAHPFSKGYPLNIPQIPSRILQKSPNNSSNGSNPQNDTENSLTLSQSKPQISAIYQNATEDIELNSNTNASPGSEITSSENMPENPPNITQPYIETPENLTVKSTEYISNMSPKIQKTSYNIVRNNTQNSIFDKCLTESKRKSLEKTVRLIESILINSNNTKSDIVENTVDPLAFSPNPDMANTNNSKNKEIGTDSDDEVLVKKLPTKNKRKSPANKLSEKIDTTNSSNESSTEIQIDQKVRIEDIKIEPMSWPDIEYGNPFQRDSNGVLRSDVGNVKIIDLENSVEEALATIKSGLTSIAYFECPHCLLLLQHPKRFLIHTKWHTFGLLNEKRAEIAKEREERTREKREARSIQRLSATLATGDEEQRFPCKDCDSVFLTKTGLKNHRHKAHPTEVTECRICFVPVRGMGELRAHMTSHEAAGLHQCPRCPKRFKYRHSLAKHADTHREKTHSCSACGKLFGSSALVRLHMKVHERAARGVTHRCAYCGKGFYEAYNLQVHERTHKNDKPFKCDICESCFVTNSSLKRHVKVSHSGAKPYPCQVCQKCFASATIRDRHELRVHADQDQLPHPCQLCPRRYMKPKDLRNHTYKMHPKVKKKVTSDTEHNSP